MHRTYKPKPIPTIQHFENGYCVHSRIALVDSGIFESFGAVKSVGVDNLLEVEYHHVSHVFGSTSHHIKFLDGGEIKLIYNQQGLLLDLDCNEMVSAQIHDKKHIVFLPSKIPT